MNSESITILFPFSSRTKTTFPVFNSSQILASSSQQPPSKAFFFFLFPLLLSSCNFFLVFFYLSFYFLLCWQLKRKITQVLEATVIAWIVSFSLPRPEFIFILPLSSSRRINSGNIIASSEINESIGTFMYGCLYMDMRGITRNLSNFADVA